MTEQASLGDVSENKSEKSSPEEAPELISGVAWSKIEGFPEDWEANELDGDVDLQTGNNFPSENFVDEGGLPLIRIRDLPTGEPETNYNGEYDEQHVIEPQDLLVGMDGEFKPYLWKGEKALLNQRVLKIESEKYNKFFLRYALDKPLRYIQKSIAGTTVKHLSQKNVKKINLPTADIDEQRRIASVLYNVDQAISKTEEIIEQTQRVKKGLMQDLFTEGYYSHKKFEEIRLGPKKAKKPKSWEKFDMEEIAEVTAGYGFSSDKFTSEEFEDSYQVIKMGNIFDGGLRLDKEPTFIQEKDLTEKERKYILDKGDILITLTGTVDKRDYGKVGLVDEDDSYLLNQRIGLIKPEKVNSTYLHTYVQTRKFRDIFFSKGHGGTGNQENVSITALGKMDVLLPPEDEQKEFEDKIQKMNELITSNQRKKEQLQRLKKGLMQDLLTGSVRTGEDVEVLDEVVEVEG